MGIVYGDIQFPVELHAISIVAVASGLPNNCCEPERHAQLIIFGNVPDGVEGSGKNARIGYLIDPSEHVKAVVVFTDVQIER